MFREFFRSSCLKLIVPQDFQPWEGGGLNELGVDAFHKWFRPVEMKLTRAVLEFGVKTESGGSYEPRNEIKAKLKRLYSRII